MTTCTPLFALPYQLGTDRPCDASTVWCDFTNTVVALFDSFESVLNRTARTIPMAKISNPSNQADPTTNLVFDTENVDTNDMVDLSASPAITITLQGKYAVVGYILKTPTAGVNVFGMSNRRNFFTIAGETDRHGGSTIGAHPMDLLTIEPRTTPDPLADDWQVGDSADIFPNFTGAQAGTINRVEVMAYWFGDPT